MTVYILSIHFPYEGDEIVSLHSSLALAETARNKHHEEHTYFDMDSYRIREHEVES